MIKKADTNKNYKMTRNYLQFHQGYTISQAHKIMRKYSNENHTGYGKDMQSLHKIGEFIQQDWNKFMQFYKNIKNEIIPKDKNT